MRKVLTSIILGLSLQYGCATEKAFNYKSYPKDTLGCFESLMYDYQTDVPNQESCDRLYLNENKELTCIKKQKVHNNLPPVRTYIPDMPGSNEKQKPFRSFKKGNNFINIYRETGNEKDIYVDHGFSVPFRYIKDLKLGGWYFWNDNIYFTDKRRKSEHTIDFQNEEQAKCFLRNLERTIWNDKNRPKLAREFRKWYKTKILQMNK